MNTRDASKWLSVLGLGLVAGYVISLWVSDDHRAKHKKMIEDSWKKGKQIISDEERQKRIKAIFNEYTERSQAKYAELQSQFLDKISEAKDGVKKIDKKKYLEVVKETLDDAKINYEIAEKGIKKLKSYWEKDFDLLKKSFE